MITEGIFELNTRKRRSNVTVWIFFFFVGGLILLHLLNGTTDCNICVWLIYSTGGSFTAGVHSPRTGTRNMYVPEISVYMMSTWCTGSPNCHVYNMVWRPVTGVYNRVSPDHVACQHRLSQHCLSQFCLAAQGMEMVMVVTPATLPPHPPLVAIIGVPAVHIPSTNTQISVVSRYVVYAKTCRKFLAFASQPE